MKKGGKAARSLRLIRWANRLLADTVPVACHICNSSRLSFIILVDMLVAELSSYHRHAT